LFRSLLKPDGTPIACALIRSWVAGAEEVLTDEGGRFTLSGFAPGNASLSFSNFRFSRKFVPADDFIVLPQRVEALKAGETRDIGDWKAQTGTLVSGLVVDMTTKKPVVAASVWLYDKAASSTSHYTDEQGHYQVRVSDAGARSASFSSENHVPLRLNNVSIPKDAATFEMATVELERGVRVAGTAQVQDGSALSDFALTATGPNRQSKVAQGTGYGHFSFGALQPGNYTLTAGSHYSGQTNRFELVSPTSFTVPPAGEKMAPLKVFLKPITGQEKLPTRLTGRVVDETGCGVAGAVVSLRNGNYTNPILAVAGEDGRYELLDLASDAKLSVEGVERPGYVGAAKPAIEREGEVLRVADFVLKRRGSRFVGRVLDAAGKPVAGALVTPVEVESIEPVESAADGTFVLLDLPAGDFTLLAAQDRLSATQKTDAKAQNVELRLAPPAPIDTQELVQKWIERGGGWWGENDFDAGLGVERMEQLALKGAANSPMDARTSTIFAWFVSAAARNEPDWTRRNAARLLARLAEGADRKAAETDIALLRASGSDAAGKKEAQAWLERERAETGGITEAMVTRYGAMARVARALNLPETGGLLDFAAQIADQLPAATRLSNAMRWGTQIAPLGENAFTGLIENWDAPARLAAWGGAARGFAAGGDIESARRALKTLDALAADPAIKAASANETRYRSYATTPELVIQGARGALVRALSERDPAAALVESAAIADNFAHQNALLWVANGARLRGDKATAIAALRQVFKFNIGNTEPFALAAWYGAQIDPALGEELFAKARARVEKKSSNLHVSYGIGDVAYYLARIDPAQSRVLVEREWSRLTPSFSQKTDQFGDANPNSAATKLVRAMLVIDPARGAEMATQLETAEAGIPDVGRQRGRERTGWITALVANEAAQARGDLEARY
ncbi:MAG: carboxypeptidase regulatory-like domain-containing protein, partial [Armatimonadetes bacterium]|nr:carboxypeptidase regulatory-like domain-containing protein [Armatimonadota bacterium]